MSADAGPDVHLEIGHVLFMDVVGYSKLLLDEQRELQQQLTEVVRNTEQVRAAEAAGKLIRVPAGDGMALVFLNSPEAPVQCAIEVSKALRNQPDIHLRMGIHSGPINEVRDVNDRINVAGAGINIAQRVMDCGDAGHILLSRRVAEDLAQSRQWRPYLHDLGECAAKHGVPLFVVNLYSDEVGNPQLPEKFKLAQQEQAAVAAASRSASIFRRKHLLITAGALAIAASGIGFWIYSREAAIPPSLPEKSIAVLPFNNQNRDPDTEYLSDGIPESIINSLSQLPNLRVMSRNSVFHYKGKDMDAQAVGKELKVQAVLTGRMTQRGDGLSISVELINAQDNSQIWGQQYNRKLADVFAVQEEIAKEISEKLRLKLTSTEQQQLAKRPTENLKAFQYYMQGRTFIQRRTREDLLAAVSYNERAIEEDGTYALAYAGLADAYANLGLRGYIAPLEGRRKAEEAARKALALDENLAEAHVAVSQSHVQFVPYNFSLGDRELRRAIELSPSLAMAHEYLGFSLLKQGRLDEGLAESLKARELDPLSSIIAREVSFCYHLKRANGQALELLRQANELGPALTTQWEIGAYIQNGLYSEALAELEKAKQERKSDPILIYSTGLVYAAQGKRTEALQIIKELEAMSGPNLDQAHWIAKIFAALKEKEMAFSWLERGLPAGAIGAFYKDEPVWDPIRSDPRFADLVRRMGILP